MIHRLLIPELRGLKHCKLLVNRDLLAFNAHFFIIFTIYYIILHIITTNMQRKLKF